jgi:hypothetical protein
MIDPGNAGQNLLQMLGCTDTTKRARRIADDANRLAEERALSVGARSDVDGVLQYAGNRAVVFRGDEQNALRRLQFFAESHPIGRRRRFQILIEKGDAVQGHDAGLDCVRRQFSQGIGDLEREALFAKAAGNDDDIVGVGHEISF